VQDAGEPSANHLSPAQLPQGTLSVFSLSLSYPIYPRYAHANAAFQVELLQTTASAQHTSRSLATHRWPQANRPSRTAVYRHKLRCLLHPYSPSTRLGAGLPDAMKAAPLLVSWHNENAPIYSAHFEPHGKGRLATAGGDNNVRVRHIEAPDVYSTDIHSYGTSRITVKSGRSPICLPSSSTHKL
jgi:hypothetical protein